VAGGKVKFTVFLKWDFFIPGFYKGAKQCHR